VGGVSHGNEAAIGTEGEIEDRGFEGVMMEDDFAMVVDQESSSFCFGAMHNV
jgi:hypothetical protein